ncbi:MAG: dihydrodipicolinate synthase family protein [Clostridia bacterium]|jgi:dihydrodipicolinate synthase/N-acetylneuraminate lyase|nr:dihydrodipicolinate synthase family protein [Clostridia bacterium]
MMSKRYPITMLCAACIPWTDDFQFDEAKFRVHVADLVDGGAKSLYIMGTAGEGYTLDTKTFTDVVTAFLDECSKGKDMLPMIGIISTSMMEMMERIEIAKNLGAHDFQIALPCWGALTDGEVIDYFKMVCGSFTDCRFIHYNNGPRSKKLVTIDLYIKLAKLVPNLVAAKYSTHNMAEIYGIVTADCPIAFYLVDGGYTYGAMVGECGFLNSFYSIYPEFAWEYFEAGQTGDYATLIKGDRFYKEASGCFSFISRPMIDSAYDKSIERVTDNNFDNKLYPPYKGLTEDEFAKVNTDMKAVIAKYKK